MKRTVKKKKVTLFHRIEPLLYLAPAFLVLGVFVYYPFFKTIGESFFLLNSMGQLREFIGKLCQCIDQHEIFTGYWQRCEVCHFHRAIYRGPVLYLSHDGGKEAASFPNL